MKKIILIIAILSVTCGLKAQTNKEATKQTAEKKEYCCPKCDHCSTTSGKCPTHNLDLVKNGNHYCEKCKTTSKKACKCSKCGKDMKKMEHNMDQEMEEHPKK